MNYSQKALLALHHQDLTKFKHNYHLALTHDSDDAQYALASQLYNVGFSVPAKRIYERLLKKYPSEDEIKSNLAEIAIDDGQDDLALNYLSQVKPDSPDYVQSLMVAADLYQTQGLLGVSLQKLLTAKKLAPHENVITFALAELYFTMRRYDDAIPLYLHLIKKGIPKYSEVNLVERIGVAYADAGHFGHAIGYLKQIHLNRASSDVRFEIAFTYLQLGKYNNANRVFRDLHDLDEHYTSLYPYWGDTLEHLNRNQTALKIYQAGLKLDQYNENLWEKAGRAAVKANQLKLAEKYYLKGYQIAPDNLTIAVQLSDLYLQTHQDRQNIKFLASYVRDDNLDPQLLWNLATTYHRLNDFKLAQGYYHHAESYFADNPSFLKEAGLFYREAGRLKESNRLLEKYVKLVPDDDEIISLLNRSD